MFSPDSYDILVTAHYADLARQADAERLANQVIRRRPGVRSRLAEALYGLAVRLDPCAAPQHSVPSSGPA